MSLPTTTPTVTSVIPSYLYEEYSDDQDLQAFVNAYNTIAQQYLDWLNNANLPIYTGPIVSGALLDWIGAGLYGFPRPSLPDTNILFAGPYNTAPFNALAINQRVQIVQEVISPGTPIGSFAIGISSIGETITPAPSSYYASDDIYRRCITWLFFKGDGQVFNIEWLKRRIMRFLLGESGVNYNVDETYRIGVTFSANSTANINIVSGSVSVTSQSTFNSFSFNSMPFNGITSVYTPYTPFALAPVLKTAIDAGILPLPFQYTWIVSTGAG